MLVYGDHTELREPRGAAAQLAAQLAAIAGQPAGLARHAALVGALIEASELVQGLTDHACAELDARTAIGDAGMRVLVAIAAAIDASWSSGFRRGDTAAASAALAQLTALALPAAITARRAEGYAFYALYPEAYLAAARAAPPGPRQVIGLRSIGAGLAAVVAAATGAPLPATVRPRGDPFHRRIAAAPELVAAWSAGDGRLAIVDEGPGMSGSSIGAVADLLEDAGMPLARIECFPSHAGALGPAASARHRERWRRITRHVVDADALLVRTGRLARWIAELVGPIDQSDDHGGGPSRALGGEHPASAALDDISGGAWRARVFASEAAWPPAVVHQERRKLLVRAGGATWLARFVGLGRDGERALARARTLHRAGFTPEVAGLCHGFLIERWLAAPPLDPARLDRDGRRRLVERVGSYLGFRARALPATADRGASLTALAAMVERNASLALGAAPALPGSPAALEPRVRRIEIDGRMHAWEWLVVGDGTLIKADAIDHCAAHDLVGCQDVTWDLAGAVVELALSQPEQARLAAVCAEVAGRTIDPGLLAFLRPCYLAFQLGRHALAAELGGPEADRLRAAAQRYADQLAAG